VRVAVPDLVAAEARTARAALREAAGRRHELHEEMVDLDAYAASGLPTTTMGRQLKEDALFFAAPLAAGSLLARTRSS